VTIDMISRDPDGAVNRILTVGLCRIVGLALFGMGLVYWTRLIGVFDGDLWRFDLMPVWWRVAAPTLAVIYPVAGIGLWMTASWGTVVWVLIAAIEGVMRLGFPHLFGAEPVVVGLHVAGLAFLAVLRAFAAFQRRRRPGRS
jgi:hypothetical protein